MVESHKEKKSCEPDARVFVPAFFSRPETITAEEDSLQETYRNPGTYLYEKADPLMGVNVSVNFRVIQTVHNPDGRTPQTKYQVSIPGTQGFQIQSISPPSNSQFDVKVTLTKDGRERVIINEKNATIPGSSNFCRNLDRENFVADKFTFSITNSNEKGREMKFEISPMVNPQEKVNPGKPRGVCGVKPIR